MKYNVLNSKLWSYCPAGVPFWGPFICQMQQNLSCYSDHGIDNKFKILHKLQAKGSTYTHKISHKHLKNEIDILHVLHLSQKGNETCLNCTNQMCRHSNWLLNSVASGRFVLLEGPDVCIDDVTESGSLALKITWTPNAEVNTSNRK